jgi:hypothetical protein
MSGAETEPNEEVLDQDIPPEDDPDLLGEDEVEDQPPKEKVHKKRGRRPQDQDLAKAKQRPFVESQVRQSLAKSDITEVMNRWDWESGDYEVAIKRVQPQTFMGRNTYGFIASFTHAIDEAFIQDNFGGGVYDLTIRGPHPKTGATRSFLDGCRVKVSGPPRMSPMDPSLGGVILSEPSQEMAPMTQARKLQDARGWTVSAPSNGGGGLQDRSMDKMAFETMASQARKDREEVSRLQNRLLEEASKSNKTDPRSMMMPQPDTSLQKEAFRMTQIAIDKASEAQKEASDKFERVLEKVGSQQRGIPPELLQSLSEQHRAEMSAQATSFQTQLSSERDRFDREMSSIRDRNEREIQQTRASMQERLDRAQSEAKRDVDDSRKDFDRYLQMERERADRDRESAAQSYKMQIEHMRALHDGQVSQLTSTHQMQIAQLTSQHEASLKMQEASFAARISSLDNELARTRSDLTSAQSKISEQGDLVQQATRLKTVGEALGGAFGLSAADRHAALVPVHDREAAEPEVKGFLGTLMKFADSKLGANMFDFLKVAAAQAAGFGPQVPMVPGQLQGYAQGPYPGHPVYPQAPPGYAPPPYGAPYGAPYQGQQPGEEEDEYDEEYEEGEEEEQEGEEQAAESTPEPEQKPSVSSSVGSDGVVRGNVSYGRPNYMGPEEKQKKPAPKPQQQKPSPAPMTQEEAVEQARILVQGVEEAMNDHTPPDHLAAIIAKVAPREQLIPFATAPLPELISKLVEVAPETMLATFAGRQYLGSLQVALRQTLEITS